MKPFSKVLIANRGEIAVRIIRACKELGISTVAVYSTADENSLHVSLADEALCIGPPAPKQSYLNIAALMSVAEICDVDAIHPGYGFLAENPEFASICDSCGITFIGPSADVMKKMGDKVSAKNLMKKAGVPVIPGTIEKLKNPEDAVKEARKIGYPVIIKASAGGGGKGMRICHNDSSLMKAFVMAQNEAQSAFGDGGLYVEKYIERPRHIEVQIMADKYGNVIHLWERDCTIQRKHQKLIEEAPSPVLNQKQRVRLCETAVKGAKAAGYFTVGTMEFLLDEDGNFYFIEMNTRIQVEHTVTEEITGIDLVKEQILLAAGQRLRYKQSDISINGAAIECRVNAEDAHKGFAPSPGGIDYLYLPGGRNVRVDTHIYAGYKVPPFYDSMICKVIAKGKNREEATLIMKRAMEEFTIGPIKTLAPFYAAVMEDPEFISGKYSTGFLEKYLVEQGG